MKSKSLLVLVAAIVTSASGCGGGSANSNSTLAITTISPTSAPAGGAAFVLGVQGTNFVPGSVNFGTMPITARLQQRHAIVCDHPCCRHYHARRRAELFPPTFCTFAREFSAFTARGCSMGSL